MHYHFKVHKQKDGTYWAQSLEEGLNANTQADTLEELHQNMKEVLNLCLSEPEDSTYLPPIPDPSIKGRSVVEVAPDPQIALATMIRRVRLIHKLSQRMAAKMLEIKHIRQYQRLESGKISNPEFKTLVKLKKAFPELSLDAVIG